MKCAPVLIPTLNRFEHFKRCIESLEKCNYSAETDVIIALDFPLKENHWDGYLKIKTYLKSIKYFKSISVIERNENFGAIQNFYTSMDFLFETYDRLIFSEDDNEFSPDFLSLVNHGLNLYKDREDIFSMSGYNSPFKMPEFYKEDIYLRKGFTAWGVGLWKDKWYQVDWTMKKFNAFVDDKAKMKKYTKVAERTVPRLVRMRKTQEKLADVVLSVHLLDNKMYSIYPTVSRVRNHGHDGSGEHGGVNDIYHNQQISNGECEALLNVYIKPDSRLENYIAKQRRVSVLKKIKRRVPEKVRWNIKRIYSNLIK